MTLFRPTLRRLAVLDQISDIYGRIKINYPEATKDPLSFFEKTLNTLGVDYHIHQDDYLRIPEIEFVTIEFAVIPGKPLKPPCMDIIKRCHLMFKIRLFTNLNR